MTDNKPPTADQAGELQQIEMLCAEPPIKCPRGMENVIEFCSDGGCSACQQVGRQLARQLVPQDLEDMRVGAAIRRAMAELPAQTVVQLLQPKSDDFIYFFKSSFLDEEVYAAIDAALAHAKQNGEG